MSDQILINGFIKIGQREHIESLRNEGLILNNTVKYFKEIEATDVERWDGREGAISSIRGHSLQIKIPGNDKELPLTFTKTHLNIFDENQLLTHLFCLFVITNEHVIGKPFVDEKNLKFGKKALLINDPDKFFERFRIAIESKTKYSCQLVKYYDDNEDQHRLTVFQKPNRFKHQSEFRFHIHEMNEGPFIFKIGSIEDISQILDTSVITEINLQKFNRINFKEKQ